MSQITTPTVGQRIRQARQEAHLTHDRLAERIGSTRSHLIKLEKDKHRPRPETIARIAEGTGKPESFFADPDDEEPDPVRGLSTDDLLRALLERVGSRETATA